MKRRVDDATGARARGSDLGGHSTVTTPYNPVERPSRVGTVGEAGARGEREQLRGEKVAELRELFEGA